MEQFRDRAILAKLLLIILVFFNSCIFTPGYYIDTEVRESIWNCGRTNYVTYIWHNGEIIKAWYDDISTLTDSIVDLRKKEANDLIKTLKR